MSENVFEYELNDFDMNNGVQSLAKRRTYCAGLPCVTKKFQSEVTIWIQAYNHFEKTKRCVESVLEYTKEVDFDLILVDNNAGDGTYEYFKTLDYPKKTVIHFNQNTGSAYPFTVVPIDMISQYFVLLNNDLIVTKNWLTNLLKVMKSDPAIGVVNPSSNNVSNLQGMEFKYNSYEEMQGIAEQINVSDNAKWEERLRIVTLGTLVRKECLYAMGWPFFDVGFSHNFMDDDMAFRVRRAGYKLIVTRDTWICHDHPFERENTPEVLAMYERDMAKFKGKYCGVNPWEDATNSIVLVQDLTTQIQRSDKEVISILGVDTKCGMPILDIKNLFPYGHNVRTSAFCQEAKYYVDLNTICNDRVVCNCEENIKEYFEGDSYDYIIIGEPINMYTNPIRVIKEMYELLDTGGQLILSLKNTNNIISLLKSIGYEVSINEGIYQNIQVDDLNAILEGIGIYIRNVAIQGYNNIDSSVTGLLKNIIHQFGNVNADGIEMKARMMTERYWLIIEKE